MWHGWSASGLAVRYKRREFRDCCVKVAKKGHASLMNVISESLRHRGLSANRREWRRESSDRWWRRSSQGNASLEQPGWTTTLTTGTRLSFPEGQSLRGSTLGIHKVRILCCRSWRSIGARSLSVCHGTIFWVCILGKPADCIARARNSAYKLFNACPFVFCSVVDSERERRGKCKPRHCCG